VNSPALDINNLSFRYSGRETPEAFTLSVPALKLEPGAQMLLAATSGKGKSTLLSLIAGLMEPQSGSIAIAGQNIHALQGAARDKFRGQHIGMIFQTFNLLHGFSALENIMAALMFSDVPAKEHANRAGVLLNSLGIERIKAEVGTLSAGQQQRVAVARAVACGPALVLADEPTASLDPENAAIAMELIQKTCREKNAALLCVSHDPAMWGRFEVKQNL